MTNHQIVLLSFAIIIPIALLLDLGLLSKKNTTITMKTALYQTLFWVALALGFFVFLWIEEGEKTSLEYLSAYLMEWSLSIDNIFVFILLFTSYKVKEMYYGRVLLIGILMAIILRIIFITLGVALVQQFGWVLYIFGAFLIYTGIKMFLAKEDDEYDPQSSKINKFLQKYLPITYQDSEGKYIMKIEGKTVFTGLFVVVIMLAAVDVVFALDSIPAVLGISNNPLVIYTSNIFAVLGLRSLFFLLRGAVNKFAYLQHGIAIILIFIGVKMLGEHYFAMLIPKKETQVGVSLLVIITCLAGSIFYSIFESKQK